MELQKYWELAKPFDRFVAESHEHKGLWEGIHRLVKLPEWAVDAVPADAGLRLLVIAEDWCGDASNTVPVLARWAEAAPGLELRVIERDRYPELMDGYLTNGARAIPIAIALAPDGTELGHWGPRPATLQAWVMENKPKIPKAELYPEVRKWYARDRGETTLREVAQILGLAVPA